MTTAIDLFESFVVDKACSILWNVELALLQVFTKFPGAWTRCQASWQPDDVDIGPETKRTTFCRLD